MSGQTAGYVDAGPVIAGTLRELATLRPPVPVLSLYLDLDPREFGTQPARRSAVTSLLDTAHKRIGEFSPKRSRGAAIFAASAADVFRPYLLPRPTPTRVVIDDSRSISALVRAADLRDWLIVLVDSRHARLMHGNTDHIEEIERVTDSVPGRHERAGPSDHQRHVEKAIDVHLEHVAHELDAQLATGVHRRVILGGPPEIPQRRVETLLHDEREVPSKVALERALEEAVVQSAAILPMRHAPEALDQHGHIAAMLRF